ncbi:hypothetical protein ABW636_00905 [Aquimarina sp. 2201CG1-2-11]|uniref:hypothetical protein n=1 Tax=Aquimarina discodermiae TaxID=3231043 RepID=UPI00346313E4
MKHFSNEFCELELFEHYVVVTIQENVNFTLEKATVIRDKLRKYYKSKHFILISNRKFNHTVSYDIYKHGALSNMKGIAIVSTNCEERNKALKEQPLYGKSFTFFDSVEDAKSWAETFF